MDYKNAEGYADPTAYEALTAVAKSEKPYKPLVYIASPYAGDTETNVRRAQGYCRFAVTKNCIPIAPHLHYPQFMDDSDKEQRELGLFFALVLLGKCDELWIFGDRVSNGMSQEIKKAENRGIEQMAMRCPTAEIVGSGMLQNYELQFNRVATVVPNAIEKDI